MSTARRQYAKATTGRDPYGQTHQTRRKQLLKQLASAGVAPCPICGKPMTASMRLHLDHSDPTTKLAGLPGDRLTHAKCNASPRVRAVLDASKRPKLTMNGGDVVVPRHRVCCDNCERHWNQTGQAPSRCW